jgi:hypothetical protein
VLTTFALDSDAVFSRLDALHARIFAWFDAQHIAPSRVAHHVSWFVLPSPLPVCAGHFLPRVQHANFVLFLAHLAALLRFPMDERIQLAAGFVIW